MTKVRVEDFSYGGLYIYSVYVDEELYDTLYLRKAPRLTWAQLKDIAAGYQEWFDSAPE